MTTIEAVEHECGPLPEAYRSFLAELPESFTANDILVYGLDAVAERNETFEAPIYCPGYLAVGDDGGGTAIMLSLSTGEVFTVDIGAMSSNCLRRLAPSFTHWQKAGFPRADSQ